MSQTDNTNIKSEDPSDSDPAGLSDLENLPANHLIASIIKRFSKRTQKLKRFCHFSKLPTELKVMIYDHHLTLADKICPRRWGKDYDILSSFRDHVRNCPLNEHEVVMRHRTPHKYCCKAPFGDDTIVFYGLPPSRLALLLTSREVYQMAVSIFYRRNHFVFDCKYKMSHIRDFLDGIGCRQRFLSELSFQYAHHLANSVFKDLSKLQFLTRLHIVMDIESVPLSTLNKKKKFGWDDPPRRFVRTLKEAPGIANLLKIKDLVALEISGRDRIDDGSDCGILVDIHHKHAIGPIMMHKMQLRRIHPEQCGCD